MRDFVQVALALAGAACVTFFYSELLFFNEAPAQGLRTASGVTGTLATHLELFLFYFGLALVLSAALSAFSVRSWAGWILAAALYGWATEAVFVPSVHEAPPVSWVWTSLVWHVPIDVGLGVCLLPGVLQRDGHLAWAASAGVGVFWGVWSTWVWVDGTPALTPGEFAAFVLRAFPALVIGTLLLARHGPALLRLPRALQWIALLLAFPLVVLNGLTTPLSLAALAGLIAVTFLALWKEDRRLPHPAQPDTKARGPTFPHLLARAPALLPAPLCAVAAYSLCWLTGWALPLGGVVTLTTIVVVSTAFAALVRPFTSD